MKRRIRVAAASSLLALSALGLAACGGDDDEGDTAAQETAAGQQTATLAVSLSDFRIAPKDGKVDEADQIVFDIKNDGETTHQLTIEAQGESPHSSDTYESGEDFAFIVRGLDPGRYIWYCPIDNHRERGMEGTLTVGGDG